ncbi:MAG: potassium channel family protein [Gaiella sp.]|nr:potassium channel family protein [Gaiella sp.]
MTRPSFVERQLSRFESSRLSVRSAVNVIVVATFAVVVIGGALIRVLDGDEYSSIWEGMWWALQTVTTVGYGDVVPQEPLGRLVAAFVMLEGVAFLAIATAAITSAFVSRAGREWEAARDAADERRTADTQAVHGRIDELHARLDRIEALLSGQPAPKQDS